MTTALDRLILEVGRLHLATGSKLLDGEMRARADAYDRAIDKALEVVVRFRDAEKEKRSAGQRRRRGG